MHKEILERIQEFLENYYSCYTDRPEEFENATSVLVEINGRRFDVCVTDEEA